MQAPKQQSKKKTAGKKAANDSSRERPLTLATLGEFGALKGLTAPSGPFEPNGAWKHVYQIWLVGSPGRVSGSFLSLHRSPAPDGKTVTLSVEMAVAQVTRSIHATQAEIVCAADALSTPLSWQIESKIISPKGDALEVTRMTEKAEVKNGKIEIAAGKRTLSRQAPQTFTSNWALFDVVQRLAFAESKPLDFALLEDLDLLKEGQRISRYKDDMVSLGGSEVPVHGFQQIGAGVLPYQYWLDGQHRLLVALSGIRAYIWDPDAKNRTEPAPAKKGKKA